MFKKRGCFASQIRASPWEGIVSYVRNHSPVPPSLRLLNLVPPYFRVTELLTNFTGKS